MSILLARSVLGAVALCALSLTRGAEMKAELATLDETSFRTAAAAEGVILIRANGTIVLSAPIEVRKSLRIDAAGYRFTLSGARGTRLFQVHNGANLALVNVSLMNGFVSGAKGRDASAVLRAEPGQPGRGGCILNDGGHVRLISCVLTNNEAAGGAGGRGSVRLPTCGAGGDAQGGAIYIRNGTLTCFDVLFSGNSAIGGMAGVYSNIAFPSAAAGGSAFGGAIFNEGGSVLVTNSTLAGNHAIAADGYPGGTARGGALCQRGGSSELGYARLLGNSADGLNARGTGAIAITRPGSAQGGAIAAEEGSLSIRTADCVANIARAGGGFRTSGAPAAEGGAVFNAATLLVTHTFFASNCAIGGGGSGVNGAGRGGVIFNGGEATLMTTLLASNLALGGNAGVARTASAPGYGGGIYNVGALRATNISLVANHAYGGKTAPGLADALPGAAYGGGVFNTGLLACASVTLASNMALAGGPGAAALGGNLATTNGTVLLSRTLLAGGGTAGNSWGLVTDAGCNLSTDATVQFRPADSPQPCVPGSSERLAGLLAALRASSNQFSVPSTNASLLLDRDKTVVR